MVQNFKQHDMKNSVKCSKQTIQLAKIHLSKADYFIGGSNNVMLVGAKPPILGQGQRHEGSKDRQQGGFLGEGAAIPFLSTRGSKECCRLSQRGLLKSPGH